MILDEHCMTWYVEESIWGKISAIAKDLYIFVKPIQVIEELIADSSHHSKYSFQFIQIVFELKLECLYSIPFYKL